MTKLSIIVNKAFEVPRQIVKNCSLNKGFYDAMFLQALVN